MRRLLAALAALLLLTGCSQVLGTADWNQVRVDFQAGSTEGQEGNYTLLVTPTEAVYTLDGKSTSHELPQGAWDALTAGIRTLGERTSEPCPGGQFLSVEARAGDAVKHTYQASSCDAGNALAQAQALLEQLIGQLR